MFAPTTNKVVINQPTISNMNRVLNKPTTITAKPIVPKFGRDTGTSKLSMNFNPNGNNFGFNQDYLSMKSDTNNRAFGFQPLYAKVGEDEVPIEDSLVVDARRVKDI